MKPLIFINFKTYVEGTGKKALKLAKTAEKVSEKTKTKIFLIVQAVDIHPISKAVSIPVWTQHVDPYNPGSHTGHTLIESVKEAGAAGTILNHSENRISMEQIKAVVEKAKKLRFPILVCVENLEEAETVARLGPDYLALEEKELIGTGRSISEEQPEAVKKFVKIVTKNNPKVVPLCGAGVSTKEDVKASVKLGTKGVLLASAVVKAKNQKKVLTELSTQ